MGGVKLANLKKTNSFKIKKRKFSELFSFLIRGKDYPRMKNDKTMPLILEDMSEDESSNVQRTFTCQLVFRSKKFRSFMEIFSEDQIKRFNKNVFGRKFFLKLASKSYSRVKSYNNMVAEEQKTFDIKRKIQISLITASILVLIFATIFSVYNPDAHLYHSALTEYSNKNYSVAASDFTRCSHYENSEDYYTFCSAMALMGSKDYSSAQKLFDSLKSKQSLFSESLDDLSSECFYNEAVVLSDNKNYDKALSLLKEKIPKYKKTKSLQTKLFIDIGDSCSSQGKISDAVDAYETAKKLGDKESAAKIENIASSIYSNAQKQYALHLYDPASKKFCQIKSYKNADFMSQQCLYEQALLLFQDREYDLALANFQKIKTFKDSIGMQKECIYQKAKMLSNYDSIVQLWQIPDYRDTQALLKKVQNVIYGEWKIQTSSIAFTANQTFSVDGDLKILTANHIVGISQSVYSFDHKTNAFISDSKSSVLNVEVRDINHIIVHCSSGKGVTGKQATYACLRQKAPQIS